MKKSTHVGGKNRKRPGGYASLRCADTASGMRTFGADAQDSSHEHAKKQQKHPRRGEKTESALEGMLRYAAQIPQAVFEPSALTRKIRLTSTQKNNKSTHVGVLLLFLARPGGFEPSTYRFVAGHSIH